MSDPTASDPTASDPTASDPTASTELRHTPLHDEHVALGARMVDFGGWHMPIQYAGIREEHLACRAAGGLFDVSHMGEVRLRGDKALEAARYLVCNDMDIAVGQAQYSPMCQPDGGIVDDLIVYHLAEGDVLICVNAANRDKDLAWIQAHNPFPESVTVTDEGDDWGQIAIQGRVAERVLQQLTDAKLSEVRYYWLAQGAVAGIDGCLIARTGYTGEDGFEVFVPAAHTATVWRALLAAGQGQPEGDLVPVGLGARDTLRLEARMCLYGNDIDATTTPLEAALGWTVKLEAGDFIGRDALVAQKAARPGKRLVALIVDKRIARPHCAVLHDGTPVGEVTSGTKSPSLGENIALAYVPPRLARPGTALRIDIRGRMADAVVHKGAFYTRPY